jgi:hypothetical protein
VLTRARARARLGARRLSRVWADGRGRWRCLPLAPARGSQSGRLMSTVHDAYVCPLCYLWLRQEAAEEADGGAAHGHCAHAQPRPQGAGAGAAAAAPTAVGAASDPAAAAETRALALLQQPCHPLLALYNAPSVVRWVRDNPAAIAPRPRAEHAVGCLAFASKQAMYAHWRNEHSVPARLASGSRPEVRAGLDRFHLRAADGLVQRW